jgi:hypothetical protein
LTAVGKSLHIFIALLAALAAAPSASAQRVTMTLDTAVIAIGQPTLLRLQADRSLTEGRSTFAWPYWQDTIPGGLEILRTLGADTTATEAENGDPVIRIERAYLVTAWDSGYLAIPPAELVWGSDTVTSNPVLLNVLLAPPGEPGQIAGHADIRRVGWTWQERARRWLPWVLAFLAVLALTFAIVRWLRNRTVVVEEPQPRPVPLEPAHIVALRELERISAAAVWKTGHVKEHHAEVSEVIRTYFERRYKFPAMERSTDEIRSGLAHLPIRTAERELILELLSLTDLVKFAKWTPQQSDHLRVVEQSIRFVELTTVVNESHEA